MNWKETLEVDRQSKALDKKILMLYNQNMSEKDILKETGVNELYIKEGEVFYFIDEWTKKSLFGIKTNRLASRLARNNDFVKSVTKKGHDLKITTQNGEIEVSKLSKVFPILKKINGNEIETSKRDRKCESSITVAMLLKSDCKVVTGYNCGFSDKTKYVHSWVEFELQCKEYVVDYTLNALFNKEGFYDLNKVEVLSVIPYSQLKEDAEMIKKMNIVVQTREYLLDRDGMFKKLGIENENGAEL